MATDVNPEMLILARELRGLTQTQLAEQSNIPQGRISKYESALADISPIELEVVGKTLGFPNEFFARMGSRYNEEGGELFHRKRRSLAIGQLKRIHAQLNKFRLDVERLIENVDIESPYDIPIYRTEEFDGDIERIALQVRSYWGLSTDPIDNLMSTLEDSFCIINISDFRTDEIDEVVQWAEPMQPVMLVNSRAPGDRLRFSLAHALGHLVMHHGIPFYLDMEAEADQFAAAFLMPKSKLEPLLQNVTIESMAELKQDWKVSIQALIRRARDLDTISERRYRSLFQMLSRKGYRKKEPYPLARERPAFFNSLLSFYLDELNYTIRDLARLLDINEHDFRDWYQASGSSIRLVPKNNNDPNSYLPSS